MIKHTKTIVKDTEDETEVVHDFDIKITYNSWTISSAILGCILVGIIGVLFGGWGLWN